MKKLESIYLGQYALQGTLNEKKCKLVMQSRYLILPSYRLATVKNNSFIGRFIHFSAERCIKGYHLIVLLISDIPNVIEIHLPNALQKVRKATIESRIRSCIVI